MKEITITTTVHFENGAAAEECADSMMDVSEGTRRENGNIAVRSSREPGDV
jgi:hypothetical protein